jgi:hypothetical protein
MNDKPYFKPGFHINVRNADSNATEPQTATQTWKHVTQTHRPTPRQTQTSLQTIGQVEPGSTCRLSASHRRSIVDCLVTQLPSEAPKTQELASMQRHPSRHSRNLSCNVDLSDCLNIHLKVKCLRAFSALSNFTSSVITC